MDDSVSEAQGHVEVCKEAMTEGDDFKVPKKSETERERERLIERT